LKITTEALENRQLLLTIEISEKQTEQAKRQVARRISREVNIPGFRKGKAPYSVVVQRFGEETVFQEIADFMADEVYRKALEQEAIEPHAAGMLEDVTPDPLTFTFTVPLRPTVDLGDYRDYRLDPSKVEVSAEALQQALEEIREQNAILTPLERPVALGDVVMMDLVGWTADGGKFLEEDDLQVLLDVEQYEPAPGFREAIVGMEEGEERTFTLTLPDDFPEEELQGQEVEFDVNLTAVYERFLPGLDDDLARTVGSFDTFEELEEQIRNQLLEEAQREADSEYASQVLEAILEQTQVEYPPVVLQEAVDDAVENYEQAVKSQLRLSLDDYLRIQGQTLEELREELEPGAATNLKRALMLGEVIRLEEIDVDEEEIDAQIDKISAAWGSQADAIRVSLDTGPGRQELHNRLLGNKAVERLVAIAKGEAPEPTPAEAQEAVVPDQSSENEE
jgi:trigger factor